MTRLFTILLLSTLAMQAFSASPPPRGSPRPRTGNYSLAIGGIVHGNGTGSISGTQLTLTADVTGDAGSGKLDATLTLTANHFEGTGTVLGQPATFKGRIDQPDDAQERTIRGVRITATFKTADGNYGRLIGNLPTPPQSRPDTRPTPGGRGDGDRRGDRPGYKPGDRPDNPDDDRDRSRSRAR